MPQSRRRAGFAQKAKSSGLIIKIFFADDFQGYGAVQINVERLVSYAHCTATQLDRFPVFARHQLIMLEALVRLFRCRLDRFFRTRGPPGVYRASETHPEHAYWAEFHDSGKFIAATRAGALTFRVHRLGRHSALNRSRKQHYASTEWRESGQHVPDRLLSR